MITDIYEKGVECGNTHTMAHTYIIRCDSVEEYAKTTADEVKIGKIQPVSGWMGKHDGAAWDLGVHGPEACRMAVEGDPALIPGVMHYLDAMQDVFINGEVTRWSPEVSGPLVSVPSYLSGNPRCMRSLRKREGSARHVSIYVNGTCSAGIHASDMLKRGQAILALLESIQRCKISCDLFMVGSVNSCDAYKRGDTYSVIRVESRPLDIGVSGFAVAHPAFTRNVIYALSCRHGYSGGWPDTFDMFGRGNDFDGNGFTPWDHYVRDILGMKPEDVYCPPVLYNDAIIGNPELWIKTRLSQILGR